MSCIGFSFRSCFRSLVLSLSLPWPVVVVYFRTIQSRLNISSIVVVVAIMQYAKSTSEHKYAATGLPSSLEQNKAQDIAFVVVCVCVIALRKHYSEPKGDQIERNSFGNY